MGLLTNIRMSWHAKCAIKYNRPACTSVAYTSVCTGDLTKPLLFDMIRPS